jgi:hypothetical protein
MERLNGISKQRYVCPYEMAAAHATLGRRKEAFEMLAEAYRQRSVCLPALKADPRFDPLRSDPRLQELLQRMSFP